jgi:hypothetical protein
LWPSSTWIPEEENSIGEKTRSLKLELSAEPGALMGKNVTKSFKMFRSGNPEEWILWRRDFNEVCAGLDAQTGAGCIRMACQLLSDKPLKEFEQMLATFPLQTQANCNLALDAAALVIFPANAYAKQKKNVQQGLWKPKALMARNICARISELNAQLASFPFQTGLLPEDEMESTFVNLCLWDWQQEFLKTGINGCSSTWDDILSKAEAMEQAQNAITEAVGTSINKENKREREEGEVDADSSPEKPPKKKAKSAFCCKLHGYGQNHNTDQCKVLEGEFEKLKANRKPKTFSGQQQINPNNQQSNVKPNWSEINKKRTKQHFSFDRTTARGRSHDSQKSDARCEGTSRVANRQ